MSSGKWTKDQELAIVLSGNNILVSAAAGAGKTSVLVERVIRQVLSSERPLDLDRLLVVTFTEKAAAEMKQRVRASLESAFRESRDPRVSHQLALLDKAQISTIHAFCLRIVKRYFYKVDLDPGFRVLDENEAELLRHDAAAELFEELYEEDSPRGEVFRELVEKYGGKGVDEGLRSTLMRLHEFAVTQPSAEEFLERAKRQATGADMAWLKCLVGKALRDVERALSLSKEALRVCLKPSGPDGYRTAIESDISMYAEAQGLLASLKEAADRTAASPAASEVLPGETPSTGQTTLDSLAEVVSSRIRSMAHAKLSSVRGCDPDLKEEARDLRDLAKKSFESVKHYAFMRPLAQVREELRDTAPLVAGLCDLALELDRRYAEKKRDRGGVDFSDLERYCLRILEKEGGRLGREVRGEFDCILVDEYQDTNPLQERILSLVSRDDPGNVFMVGDIKQSIYRFRLAEPRLFLEKFRSYKRLHGEAVGEPSPGWRIDLAHNFRSRPQVLDAVNAIFSAIMTESAADIDYKDGHALVAGASYPEGEGYVTEVHLVERLSPSQSDQSAAGAEGLAADAAETEGTRDSGGEEDEAAADEVEEYEALEKEALVVAARIREMVGGERPLMIRDSKSGSTRPCSYRDIAILMRSTKDRANAVLEVLSRCGIPCYADTGAGYFQAREVEVALSLLSIIDNPIQDIPLAAVLRSPIVGLEPRDLSVVRAYSKKGSFYDAVKALAHASQEELSRKRDGALAAAPQISAVLRDFLSDLERWRTLARRRPLAEVLWTILTETGYHDYVGGLRGGAQRQANLRALCDRAREFDSFGRHGLIRFLRFIEKLQESQGDLGTARALGEQEDVVRLLSIHKSKGLEFPVVFVIDLGKRFNKDDLRQDVLLHRDLGVGASYVDLETRVKYPTALHQAIASQISHENLAEEMRILYVALTRAKEKLCIVGSVRELEKKMRRWRRPDAENAETYLDWVCPTALLLAEPPDTDRGMSHEVSGAPDLFKVTIWGTAGGVPIPAPPKRTSADSGLDWNDIRAMLPPPPGDPAAYEEVRRRLEWRYPFETYAAMQAKMSVGDLKRRLDGDDEESLRSLPRPTERLGMDRKGPYTSAIARGMAVHALLSRIDLKLTHSAEAIASECERLMRAGYLQRPGIDPEDVAKVAAFFASPAGISMRECAGRVLREVPFTMKMSPAVLAGGAAFEARRGPGSTEDGAADDFVIVQGVIDVLLDEPHGLTVLDYKTGGGDIRSRALAYTPQVALYALAAARIMKKPVKKASIIFLDLGREVEIDWRGYLDSVGVRLID